MEIGIRIHRKNVLALRAHSQNSKAFFFMHRILLIAPLLVLMGGAFFFVSKKIIFSSKSKIAHTLATIPLSERERLEFFFRNLITQDTFGHVLFGEKPLSFTSVLVPNLYCKKMMEKAQVGSFF